MRVCVCVVAIMRGGGGGGYGSGGRSQVSGRQITKTLDVPNELIGTIIGRHGMKISEIRYDDSLQVLCVGGL